MQMQKPIKVDLNTKVKPEWIDYNGHMNVAFYLMAFDEAIDIVNKKIGLGPDYREKTNKSTFALESHIIWLREMKLDDRMFFTVQLLDYDKKRIHFFVTMLHYDKNYEAATYEVLLMHVNLSNKKSCVFPENVRNKIELTMKEHSKLPKPKLCSSTVGIRRK